jgi:hypothetical protein
MYICMYVSMHEWQYICAHVYLYVCVYVCMHGSMYVRMYICVYVYMYVVTVWCMFPAVWNGHNCQEVWVITWVLPAVPRIINGGGAR